MQFLCPNCRKHVEVPEEKVIPYEMKGLVKGECPKCGCPGLLRWMKEYEESGYSQGELKGGDNE